MKKIIIALHLTSHIFYIFVPINYIYCTQKRLDEWLLDEFKSNARVGADLKLISNGDWEFLHRALTNKSISLVPINHNLIDMIWVDNRPEYPTRSAYVWPLEYAGQ